MGVDTRIYIPLKDGDVLKTVEAIKLTLKNKMKVYGKIKTNHITKAVEYNRTNFETMVKSQHNMYDYYSIDFALNYECDQFASNKEQRSMRAYYDHYTGGSILYLSIGAWGHNEDIAKCIVDNFGGYADFSDCDDIFIDYAKPQPK